MNKLLRRIAASYLRAVAATITTVTIVDGFDFKNFLLALLGGLIAPTVFALAESAEILDAQRPVVDESVVL